MCHSTLSPSKVLSSDSNIVYCFKLLPSEAQHFLTFCSFSRETILIMESKLVILQGNWKGIVGSSN